MALLLSSFTAGFLPGASPPVMMPSHQRSACGRALAPRMESLASKMFGSIVEGLSGIGEAMGIGKDEEETSRTPTAPAGADDVVSDLDERAKTGDITFKDFLTMSSAFGQLDRLEGGGGLNVMP